MELLLAANKRCPGEIAFPGQRFPVFGVLLLIMVSSQRAVLAILAKSVCFHGPTLK